MESGTAIREALDSGAELVTIDFWDTLVMRTTAPRVVLDQVARRVHTELRLPIDADLVAERYLDMSLAIGRLLEQLGFDHEPRSSSVWRLLLCDLGMSQEECRDAIPTILTIEVACHVVGSTGEPGLPRIDLERTLVLSDNELSSAQLRSIAEAHGLVLPRIVVSSEALIAKRSGRLFQHVLNERGLVATQLFHVGDNGWSDREVPIGLGVHVPSAPLKERSWPDSPVRPFRPPRLAPMPEEEFEGQIASQVARFIEQVHVERASSDITDVVLMGSEGAFFSQLFDVRRAGDSANYRVAALGRKDLLSAAFVVDPTWTFTQWVLAGLDLSRVSELLLAAGGDRSIDARQLARTLCEEGFVECAEATQGAGVEPAAILHNLGLDESDGPILVVDVGYRGSAARALARLTDRPVLSCMMFGEPAFLAGGIAASSHIVEIGDLVYRPRAERGDVAPKVSLTLAVETLIADGPRAPTANPELSRIRREILSRARALLAGDQSLLTDGGRLPTSMIWWQLADRPPRGIASAVLASRHHDDLAGKGPHGRHSHFGLRADYVAWPGGALAARGPVVERALLVGLVAARAAKDLRRLARRRLRRL